MSEYLLGLDNGGTVTKAALFDLEGNEIAVSSKRTEMHFPQPGYTERAIDALWKANAEAISDVIEKSGVNPSEIKAVAATGYGNGLILVDGNGDPVYNGIISTDTRAKGYVQKWYNDGTFDEVHEKTLQAVWPAQPVALLAWFKDNMPEVVKKAKWAFMCKDYLRYRLTGEAYAEISDYSGTSAMNLYTHTFDRDLFSKFGIEEYFELFPPLRKSDDICGYITEEAAAATGLKKGTPVAGGLFDIHACYLACGISDADKMCLIAGTWSINQFLAREPVPDKDIFMTSISCIPGLYLIMEGSPTSASNLEWFVKEFMSRGKELMEAKGESVYAYCDRVVGQIEPDASNIVFLPYLFGSNSHPDSKACFLGLSSWHKREHIIRALYEGIAFSTKQHYDKLLRNSVKPSMARLAGGVSKSKVWVQMFADILQIPIEITEGTELGALGAAVCAGVASGTFCSFQEAVDSMVKVSSVFYPDSRNEEIYARKYERYKKAIKISEAFE